MVLQDLRMTDWLILLTTSSFSCQRHETFYPHCVIKLIPGMRDVPGRWKNGKREYTVEYCAIFRPTSRTIKCRAKKTENSFKFNLELHCKKLAFHMPKNALYGEPREKTVESEVAKC
uniref:Uncharacterized protein n=1 Tax=Romanomermis culicivorax TaxID=13658 RepID=A0A915KF59_ROMCU